MEITDKMMIKAGITSRLIATCKQTLLFMLLAVTTTTAAGELPDFRPCRARPHKPVAAIDGKTLHRISRTTQYTGERRQMTVLVSFNDLTFREHEPLPFWNEVFNAKEFSQAPFHGSVSDYFYDQSYGQLQVHFDLHHVLLPTSRTLYRSNLTADPGCPILVQDVLAALDGIVTDWTPYDWNADGYVDQLLIIYPGKGMNDGGDYNTIWPNQSWMTDYDYEPVKVPTATAGDSLMVNTYCCVNELTSNEDYGSFGTICHEYSHCFGLPDFYNGSTQHVAKWDLMDNGNYNGGGFCPPCYSVHERMFMGWTTPTELTATTSISNMQPANSQQQAYIIRSQQDDNDYYIVENRQQQGWDKELPGSGILIFHVRYDEEVWLHGMPNTSFQSAAANRYTLKKANGSNSTYRQGQWAYPYQDNDSLTALSQPASDYEGKSLTDISVSSDGLASFTYHQTDVAAIHALSTDRSTTQDAYYDLLGRRMVGKHQPSGLYVIRFSDGTIRKVAVK